MRLTKSSSLPPAVVEIIEAYDKQFGKLTRPAFADKLVFPDDITAIDSSNVSELLGKYTQLAVFALNALSQISMAITLTESHFLRARNQLLKDKPTLLGTEKWRFDKVVENDDAFLALEQKMTEFKMKKEYLTGLTGTFEKFIYALSRELSRRGFEGKTTDRHRH